VSIGHLDHALIVYSSTEHVTLSYSSYAYVGMMHTEKCFIINDMSLWMNSSYFVVLYLSTTCMTLWDGHSTVVW